MSVDFDLSGLVGVRVLGGTAADHAAVAHRLGTPMPTLGREPDLTIRYDDRVRRDADPTLPLDVVGVRPCDVVLPTGFGEPPLLSHLVNLVVLGHGGLPLHAAAVAVGGVGALFAGWSKGGKTETVLALMNRGARLIGDEWTYVTPDGTGLVGYPEAMHVWDWQLAQLPDLVARLDPAQRARLRSARRWSRVCSALLFRLRPAGLNAVLDRRRGLDVRPEALFGADRCPFAGPLSRVYLIGTEDRADAVVEVADPADVAERIAASLLHERAPLTEAYQRFRAARPNRANPLIDGQAELERQRLDAVLAGRPVFRVRHPYPTRIAALGDALAAHLAAG